MIIGIDPGLSGAIAWIDQGKLIDVFDLPVVDSRIDAASLADMLKQYNNIEMVVIEKVSSMPGQGVVSTFKFGQSYGTLLGVFGALKYSTFHVTPRRWKKDMNLDSDKEKARALAIDTWPTSSNFFSRKKDHGRAEASLIAYWYYRWIQ